MIQLSTLWMVSRMDIIDQCIRLSEDLIMTRHQRVVFKWTSPVRLATGL